MKGCEEYINKLKKKTSKLSMKNIFIATLTHEIRNFVSKYTSHLTYAFSIIANTNLLKETGTWSEETVNELSQAANYLYDILNNSLDISKLEAGKIDFNKNYEPIHPLIDVVLGLVRTNAEKRKVNLESSLSPFMPLYVELDKSRWTQIVLNILSNAIKFTPTQGTVRVQVQWAANCGHNAGDCSTCDGCFKNINARALHSCMAISKVAEPGQPTNCPTIV